MQRDTRILLRTGSLTFLTGAISAALMKLAFGGITREGPHSNSGWMALIVAIGCLPTGAMLLALGLAKLAGDRRR